ncbi:hypothetical protein TI01_2505 [Lysobacter sp. A03]|nr:hypothetical protein TI01_2505 [Lysobacter sp. A03]
MQQRLNRAPIGTISTAGHDPAQRSEYPVLRAAVLAMTRQPFLHCTVLVQALEQ